MPQWLPQLIILLKVPPPSQMMPPWSINKNVFYPSHKDTLSPVIFRKIGDLNWNRIFSAWSWDFGIIPYFGSWDSVLRFPRWMRDIWFLLDFLASSSLQQQFQLKSSVNTLEFKWLNLWQVTAEYLEKQNLLRSPRFSIKPRMERSMMLEVEERPCCTSVSMV